MQRSKQNRREEDRPLAWVKTAAKKREESEEGGVNDRKSVRETPAANEPAAQRERVPERKSTLESGAHTSKSGAVNRANRKFKSPTTPRKSKTLRSRCEGETWIGEGAATCELAPDGHTARKPKNEEKKSVKNEY